MARGIASRVSIFGVFGMVSSEQIVDEVEIGFIAQDWDMALVPSRWEHTSNSSKKANEAERRRRIDKCISAVGPVQGRKAHMQNLSFRFLCREEERSRC